MTRVVDIETFNAEWDRCAPWLEAALEYGGGTHLLEDVRERVMTDDFCWFWPGKKAAAVSEIVIHPRLRQMNFWLCGGDLHEIIDEMLPVAEARGILAGCTRFSTSGRVGWRRVLKAKGYMPALDVCWKDLDLIERPVLSL